MGLISKKVNVVLNPSNVQHYETIGYYIPRRKNKQGKITIPRNTKILVNVEDLPEHSNVKVKIKCDNPNCNNPVIKLWKWQDYRRSVKENNKVYCNKCSINLFGRNKQNKTRLLKSKSFAQYLIDTYGQDALEKYWSDKNTLDPFNIGFCSNKKIWIKCQIYDYHEDYLIRCNDFMNGGRCSYCGNFKVHPKDSFGQYIIDNYGQEFLDKIWSNKNKKSPFEYAPHSDKKVWWKCLDNKHDDYKRGIDNSYRCEFRCPKCIQERTESMLQEKVRLYLESFGYKVLHEKKCTLKPKNTIIAPNNNSKKRRKGFLRYDNEILINNNHLFIEVMGSQHNDINALYHKQTAKKYGNTSQQELDYLQAKDNFKKQYVYNQGKNYYYLAIWYYDFDKNDTYKKLINDKIKEINNEIRKEVK